MKTRDNKFDNSKGSTEFKTEDPTMNALCIGYNSNIFMIYLDMIEAVRANVKINPTFLVPFRDEKLIDSLKDKGYEYYEFDISASKRITKWIPLPIIRLFIREILYWKEYKKVLKLIDQRNYDVFFYNDKSNNVGKYFRRHFKIKSGAISFLYEYGLGARNPYYRNEEWKKNRNILSTILEMEKYIYISVLKLIGILPREKLSKFNFGWDYLLLRSNEDARIMKDFGVPPNKIRVVGSIWRHKILTLQNNGTRDRSNDDSLINILITLQPAYDLEKLAGSMEIKFFKNFKRLLDSILRNSDNQLKLTVKFHPRDNIELYSELIMEYNNNVKWVKHQEKDTIQLIQKTDLLIAQSSTTILDALLLGKKILFYEFSIIDNPFFDYPELFEKIYTYDTDKNISDNLKLADKHKVIQERYDALLEPIDFKEKFSEFIIECKMGKNYSINNSDITN